jgi:hypothetical protein
MNLLLQDDLEKHINTLLGRASKEIMFHVLHHSFTQKQSITIHRGWWFFRPKDFIIIIIIFCPMVASNINLQGSRNRPFMVNFCIVIFIFQMLKTLSFQISVNYRDFQM